MFQGGVGSRHSSDTYIYYLDHHLYFESSLVYAQKHLDTTVHGRKTAGWYFLVHTSQPFAFTELATSIP